MFKPAKVGDAFGPTWSTHWFKIGIDIPKSFKGERVFLIFDCSSEALIWSVDGTPLQALVGGDINERHVDFKLSNESTGDEHFDFYIEMACNGLFGAGAGGNGSIFPPIPDRKFPLVSAKIAVRNNAPYQLYRDFQVYLGLIKSLPANSQLGCDALYTANQIVNVFRYDVPEYFLLY